MKAFGFCTEWGKSRFHKDKNQWELERMSSGPQCLPGQGCRRRARLNKERAQPNARCSLALSAPLGMCLKRSREGSQRASSCQGGGREPAEASCHTKTPGEVGGGLFLTNPPQRLRGCGEGGGYLWAAKCLAQARSMGSGETETLCFQPPSPAIPGLPSCNRVSELSKLERTPLARLQGHSPSRSKWT